MNNETVHEYVVEVNHYIFISVIIIIPQIYGRQTSF